MARVLGLDIGTVRIGLAISDETGLVARALKTVTRQSWKKDLESIVALIEEYEVAKIVAGDPFNMDGSRGAMGERVDDFVERLKTMTAVPIELFDERLSSSAAERVLIESGMQRARRKQVIDQLAAVVILQNFLDRENTLHPGRLFQQEGQNGE
jgi:putative holliday junction resolvase